MRDRAILHSDANCFYASVETVLNPEFRGKAIAVCGSPEERHGIVLAKSEKAKRAGVKTGMANWQAKQCCRDLIIVPPQYDYYLKFSKLLHGIYRRYTDQVEPFGMQDRTSLPSTEPRCRKARSLHGTRHRQSKMTNMSAAAMIAASVWMTSRA